MAPGGERVALDLDTRFHEFAAKLEPRDLADGTNGIVHLGKLAKPSVRSQLVLDWDEAVTLGAGTLPDGRVLSLDIRARKSPGR